MNERPTAALTVKPFGHVERRFPYADSSALHDGVLSIAVGDTITVFPLTSVEWYSVDLPEGTAAQQIAAAEAAAAAEAEKAA